MGCTATRVADMKASSLQPWLLEVVDVDQPMLKEIDSSYTLKWVEDFAKGVPCPPSRQMHDRHLEKMEKFMQKMETSPEVLSKVVRVRRRVSQEKFEALEQPISVHV
mmetsp:Transcript_13762/g.16524  ORF Transcript_13762/g.16524 Transcript_13762/m.16524 type:complete len:107 (+) Transcript_13762:84-404(+)|eukprot:Skav202359  [mRNA]  locus=scaffold53:249731:250051:- [translate_table: standard]